MKESKSNGEMVQGSDSPLERLVSLHGDCLNLLPALASQSVDMVLCDLPYGTTACSWDIIIPFDELWKQYKRVCKPTAAILLFGIQPFTTDIINSNRDWFKYEWTWVKNRPTNYLQAKRQPMRTTENVCVFYKEQPTFNPIPFEKRRYAHRSNKIMQVASRTYHAHGKETSTEEKDIKAALNLICFDGVHPQSEKYLGHPTQKPVNGILCQDIHEPERHSIR